MEKRLQQTYITKKLLESGKNYAEIKNWFQNVKTDTPVINIAELIINAQRIKWPKRKDYRVWITTKELQYIDSLPYDKEFKSFIVGMIYVAKLMKIKKGCSAFNTRDRSYAYFLSTGEDNYNIGKQRRFYINKMIHQAVKDKIFTFVPVTSRFRKKDNEYYTKTVVNVTLVADWINWDKQIGHVIECPEVEIQKLISQYVHNLTKTCSKCGKKFVPSKKSKTVLCPACYKAHRKAQINDNAKSYYRKKVRSDRDI